MIHTVKTQVVRGITDVRVMYPGPQGPGIGLTASDPVDVIYMTASDDTVHAVRLIFDQGQYTLEPDPTDSTP